jgi:hypothetical protein
MIRICSSIRAKKLLAVCHQVFSAACLVSGSWAMVVQRRLFHVLWLELNAIALLVTLLLLPGAEVRFSCKTGLSAPSWPNERLVQ